MRGEDIKKLTKRSGAPAALRQFIRLFVAAVILILLLCGCEPRVYEYDGKISTDAFSVVVGGVLIDGGAMADYPVYGCKSVSVNSYGTKTTYEYAGYLLTDVLTAAGISRDYETVTVTAKDGYSVKFSSDEADPDTTLIALRRDGSDAFSPIFAPCGSGETSCYIKSVSEITVKY